MTVVYTFFSVIGFQFQLSGGDGGFGKDCVICICTLRRKHQSFGPNVHSKASDMTAHLSVCGHVRGPKEQELMLAKHASDIICIKMYVRIWM